MSFDNPSSFAQWQSSIASTSNKEPQPRQPKPVQSPWGQLPSSSTIKRGLTPLATSNLASTSTTGTRKDQALSESDLYNSSISPSSGNFPPLLASSARLGSRRGTPPGSSHSNSPVNSLQTGAHQVHAYQSRSLTSPRSRTLTPQSSVTGTAGPFWQSGLGAGGGGVYSRSGAYSPSLTGPGVGSPTGAAFERSPSISSNLGSSTTGPSSLSKISATQILLLLDTISEREGKAKWDSKAEKIKKLLDSNGMEVFAQFFRRTVILNAAAIFSGTKDFDQGSYKLLRQELDKVLWDPEQPYKITEAIDTSKEDLFRDFDLVAFIKHFYADTLPQVILAVAFTKCARVDLRTKAEDFLNEFGKTSLRTLSDSRGGNAQAFASENVCSVIEYFALASGMETQQQRIDLWNALSSRYANAQPDHFAAVVTSSQLLRITSPAREMARLLQRHGPRSTSSKQAAQDFVGSLKADIITEAEVTNALLFLVFSANQQYDLNNFLQALQSKQLDWNLIIQGVDLPGLRLRRDSFPRLFIALRQVAEEHPQFDLQKLWGGQWQNADTQISFLSGFLASPVEATQPSTIPGLRQSLSLDDFRTISPEVKRLLEAELKTPYVSADACQAVFEVVLGPNATPESEDRLDILNDVYRNHPAIILLYLSRLNPKTWVADQEKFVAECFGLFLEKQGPSYAAVLEILSTQNPQFLFDLCHLVFQLDPRQTEVIYERAEEFGLTEAFLKHWSNPLALDLACIRDKALQDFDLDRYISEAAEGQSNFGMILCKYLRIKADDEFRVQRGESAPQSTPLSLRTVHTLLEKLEDHLDNRELVEAAQTTCLQTYPRLMNYGGGYDDILEKRSEERGNKLPESIDKQMSELFGRMYRSELSIRDMVNEMRRFKTSRDADQQDLFCCIVHGLFDEYVCYNEYPEDALEKTALLFGSIIKYKLLPAIPRDFGLALILRAVRDHEGDSLMHRFGIEALLQISDQLAEWPGLCSLLLQEPTLQHPEILQRAEEGLRAQQAAGTNGVGAATANGEDLARPEPGRGFRSLRADPPPTGAHFREPDQKVQEKILFVINNLSKDNMSSKLGDLKESFDPEHYQWFAAYLVEQRARLEPNNQQMYFQFVTLIDDNLLMSEVIRETYVSIVKMMTSESTISSAQERSHLKNLGGWLGSLTLAQDKPIKHRNIYFVDLLLEGYESQRLLLVIPFTCKILAQGANSLVFKPPNPWLMEIVSVLVELYHFADLKLNLKFEIEVLCKDLSLDFKKLEPATFIRDRPEPDDELTNVSALPDGLENFDELSLNSGLNRTQRLSAVEIMASLPNLEEVLKYPPTSGSPGDQAMIKNIILRAFDQAIQEIIAPVVERSITIASISTAQLISKDYSLEPDAERYRTAARSMVKSLAGSLALVTCKEPLRMSISNYIRRPTQDDLPEHLLPEGAILMCVNDNLDTACSFVEQAAEQRALPEIDQVIEEQLEERRRFAAEGGGRDFIPAGINRWSAWIPEPYKQTVGGLNEAQRAVYEEFDRRVHGMNANHIPNTPADAAGRQIPDVLQDPLAMPNLSTPADQPALPHQSPLVQQDRMLTAMQQPRVNGFAETLPPHERISMLIEDVQKAARASEALRLKDLEKNSSIFQDFRQILIVLTSSTRPAADLLARQIAEKICNIFVSKPPQTPLEAEVLAFLLSKLCQLSELIIRDVLRWMTANEDLLLASSNVIVALLTVGLMEFARVDVAIASTLMSRNAHGLQVLANIFDQTLFTDEPIALRADFANSLIAMSTWLKEQPDLVLASEINQKLRAHGMPQFVSVEVTDKAKVKQDQMRYIFDEWVGIFENLGPNEGTCAAFLKELHKEQTINSTEDLAEFLRLCVDSCIDCYEREAQSVRGSVDVAFSHADALARLVIMLVKFQGDTNGAVRLSKAPYLETILTVLVLILNHHQIMRGVAFHQRLFNRLFATMLYEYSAARLDGTPEHTDLILAFAKCIKSLQPLWFPGFTYGWYSLIVHRVFVNGMLRPNNHVGWESYRELLGLLLLYISELSKTPGLDLLNLDLYKGTLRNTLVLLHDYPEFLCENHSYFCSRISYGIPQLRNLILTAKPSAYHDLPDPMTPGLKIERLDEMKRNPVLAGDLDAPLEQYQLKDTIGDALRKSTDVEIALKEIKAALQDGERQASVMAPPKSVEVINALVPYVGHDALNSPSARFDPNSIHATVLTKLVISLGYEGRYQLLNAIADQIRYPNTHTDFFCKLMLHLWGSGGMDPHSQELREQISRIVYERLSVARPHVWGMTILFLELQQNGTYGFWDTVTPDSNMQQRLQQAMRTTH
ncbi:CCR4-Not complex component, Not1-domain-containing protein [Exophiala viscosa]|uniref:CCR4-Not complex component, Not1-domain-containing protein n=1 Tax=Exophiala viscosa TaxID=2486360 RepID=UPI00219D9A6A|nr:CCR4-Not complex component, Not1-domain-containing protein [Exophiala viscosa]